MSATQHSCSLLRRSPQLLKSSSPESGGYLRKLLVVGATSVIRRSKTDGLAAAPWIRAMLERRPARVVTVAMANKTARIIWAVLTRGEVYQPAAA